MKYTNESDIAHMSNAFYFSALAVFFFFHKNMLRPARDLLFSNDCEVTLKMLWYCVISKKNLILYRSLKMFEIRIFLWRERRSGQSEPLNV